MPIEIDNVMLSTFRKPLKDALEGYQEYLGRDVRFEEFPDFTLTPEKPNTARTVVPVTFSGRKAGDLYAILFQEGDGTGVICEGFFPLFFMKNSTPIMFASTTEFKQAGCCKLRDFWQSAIKTTRRRK